MAEWQRFAAGFALEPQQQLVESCSDLSAGIVAKDSMCLAAREIESGTEPKQQNTHTHTHNTHYALA